MRAEWQDAAVLSVALELPKLPPSIHDWCLERLSSASAPDRDSGILSDVALLCFIARYALYFPPLSLRQQLPRLGQLRFPPKLLRRFRRGCVVATAHGLVTAPASVFVDARKKNILRNCIFARVMSGAVMREEGRLQAAAAHIVNAQVEAGITHNSFGLSKLTDHEVLGHLIVDPNYVNKCRVFTKVTFG